MSQTNAEQSIVSAKANVMIYDDLNKKWNPSGTAPGISKVQIYQHLLNQTYRVVGRKIQDHEVVINCLLQKNLKYNQANQTFLQWRDSKQVYGLHFQSKDEADIFTQTLKMAVENLNRLAISSSSSASSTSSNGNCNVGDNISLGKRSVASAGSSSDYSQSIYDDNENLNINRPNFNMINGTNVNGVINGMIGHHPNSLNGMYNNNIQNRLQANNPTPPLSVSSSSGSSNGSLTISVNNPTNSNGYTNGYQRQPSDGYSYQNANFIQQQQQQQIMQQQSVPLYQSSPIPPPPPPPPLNINLMTTNGQSNENFNSPKIYDTIPDTGASYPNQSSSASGPPPPPPPPLPTSLFSNSSTPAPPAPPPPSLSSSNQPASSQPSYINEIAKFQANKLKKVDSEPNNSGKGSAPPGPLDFLAEIRQRIEKKNSMEKEQKNSVADNNVDTNSCKPSSLVNRSLNGKNQFGGAVNGNKSQQFESPKTIKKITSTPSVGTNGNVNGSTNQSNGVHSSDQSINYDKLKQELIVEFRKELQTFKQDIVNTILNELRR